MPRRISVSFIPSSNCPYNLYSIKSDWESRQNILQGKVFLGHDKNIVWFVLENVLDMFNTSF